jgi:2-dehydro-3-deoxygalactonokinase
MMRMNSTVRSHQHSILFDWGTTNLRAYLVDDCGSLIECYRARRGVKHVSRVEYPGVIREVSADWIRRYDVAAIVLAGMVGGDLGWRDVPLVPCPAGVEEIAAGIFAVEAPDLPAVKIVPGVVCRANAGLPGMMRGEEVQVLGAFALGRARSGCFCLPGTHTKWVAGEGGRIQQIFTSMTGEVFDLIRTHSVLANALHGWDGGIDASAFRNGLEIASSGLGALQCIFLTRVQQVIGEERDLGRRASRLSGILIGSEVLSMLTSSLFGTSGETFVIGEAKLAELYTDAFGFFRRPCVAIGATSAFVAGASLLLRAVSPALPST